MNKIGDSWGVYCLFGLIMVWFDWESVFKLCLYRDEKMWCRFVENCNRFCFLYGVSVF